MSAQLLWKFLWGIAVICADCPFSTVKWPTSIAEICGDDESAQQLRRQKLKFREQRIQNRPLLLSTQRTPADSPDRPAGSPLIDESAQKLCREKTTDSYQSTRPKPVASRDHPFSVLARSTQWCSEFLLFGLFARNLLFFF